MSTSIRPATRADRSLMVAFHHALYVDHRKEILRADLEPLYAYRDLSSALREDVDAILASPRSFAFVAERDGEPIGYITGHIEEDPRRALSRKGVIEDWYVEAEARGAGVGRALFEKLVELFRARDCVILESMTWAGNAGALEAHRALGFEQIEVKMRKRL